MTRIAAAAAALLTVVALSAQGSAAARRSVAARFGGAVQVSPSLAGGYEPGVVVDRYGNIFATAHKENQFIPFGPDDRSPTMTRSMSWTWMSTDGGATWGNIPGMTADIEQHDVGDEGDMALDDAGHLYFVDTNVADVTFTRWSVTGLGKVAIDMHRPLLPAGEPVDDRPWITAHGDGQVFYLGNQGDKVTYPIGGGNAASRVTGDPGTDANGPGRYTVYASHDGGATFDSVGVTLNDSGWCRPAADHRKGSKYVYVLCQNDAGAWDVSPLDTPQAVGKLWAFVTADDGATWKRYPVGTFDGVAGGYSTVANPTVEVAPDGSIWALFRSADTYTVTNDRVQGPQYTVKTHRLTLYHSVDHGKTWTSQLITPLRGQYAYNWLAVAPDSRTLGIGTYYRASSDKPWLVYGTVFTAGQIPTLTSLDPKNPVAAAVAGAPGDFMSCDFGPDGKLSVIWTKTNSPLSHDIKFSRSITAAPARRR